MGLALNLFQLLKLECGFNGFLHKRFVERWIILGIVLESAPGTWYQENFGFLFRPLLSVCLCDSLEKWFARESDFLLFCVVGIFREESIFNNFY